MSNVIFIVYHECYNKESGQFDRTYDCITLSQQLAEDYCRVCEQNKNMLATCPDYYRVMAIAVFDNDLTSIHDNTLLLQDFVSVGLEEELKEFHRNEE